MKTLSFAAIAAAAAMPASAHTEAVLHVHSAETGAMMIILAIGALAVLIMSLR